MCEFLNQASLLVVTCIHEACELFAIRILDFLSDEVDSAWSTERAPLDLARIYSGRPPYGGKQLYAAMWTPRTMSGWTAFLVNSCDGRSHLFRKLSQKGGGPETVSIRSTLPNEEDGVQEFEYRQADSKEYWPTRIIQWLREDGLREAPNTAISPSRRQKPAKRDGFRLVQQGEPLPFEHELVEKKPIPSPTRADLLNFVRKFGIDLENNEFWKSDADAIYLQETRISEVHTD